MHINDRFRSDQESTPLESLQECMDGFVLLGYTKNGHKKVVQLYANDPACRDALSFFNAAISAWIEMGQDELEEEES